MKRLSLGSQDLKALRDLKTGGNPLAPEGKGRLSQGHTNLEDEPQANRSPVGPTIGFAFRKGTLMLGRLCQHISPDVKKQIYTWSQRIASR
jgi:hypothetical protein